eukprot:snap_masked-scaffold_7-processed-gene-16.15-mRNA-1 protein AED:1.00 eAED:1.00 QI:0/-1/0/0/-1/1/1/0/341
MSHIANDSNQSLVSSGIFSRKRQQNRNRVPGTTPGYSPSPGESLHAFPPSAETVISDKPRPYANHFRENKRPPLNSPEQMLKEYRTTTAARDYSRLGLPMPQPPPPPRSYGDNNTELTGVDSLYSKPTLSRSQVNTQKKGLYDFAEPPREKKLKKLARSNRRIRIVTIIIVLACLMLLSVVGVAVLSTVQQSSEETEEEGEEQVLTEEPTSEPTESSAPTSEPTIAISPTDEPTPLVTNEPTLSPTFSPTLSEAALNEICAQVNSSDRDNAFCASETTFVRCVSKAIDPDDNGDLIRSCENRGTGLCLCPRFQVVEDSFPCDGDDSNDSVNCDVLPTLDSL